MGFTDGDLKRLKDQCTEPLLPDAEGDLLLVSDLKALLARLEAAEATLKHLNALLPPGEFKGCLTYQAWREACGKAGK